MAFLVRPVRDALGRSDLDGSWCGMHSNCSLCVSSSFHQSPDGSIVSGGKTEMAVNTKWKVYYKMQM